MDAAILDRLFRRALRRCKFFPKVSEILEPLATAEANAAPEAAEKAWTLVYEIRRAHWNPDIPGPFNRAVSRLSERVRQAARAAGLFREFTAAEFENGALHTWAKKRFVESFIRYGELEQDGFLLPDGEIKKLLAGVAELKALPPTSAGWRELHARGLEYAKTLKEGSERLDAVQIMPKREAPRVVDIDGRRAELQRQAEMIRKKYPKAGNTVGNPPELQPLQSKGLSD